MQQIISVRWRQKPPVYYLQSLLLLMEANPLNIQLMIQKIIYAEFDANRNSQGFQMFCLALFELTNHNNSM